MRCQSRRACPARISYATCSRSLGPPSLVDLQPSIAMRFSSKLQSFTLNILSILFSSFR